MGRPFPESSESGKAPPEKQSEAKRSSLLPRLQAKNEEVAPTRAAVRVPAAVKKLTILEKNRLKNCIQENGGQVKFVLNQECTHVVTDDADALSSIHLKAIQKNQLPVVDPDFIWNSVKERRLLQTDNYEPQKILAHNTELARVKQITVVMTADVKQSLDHGDSYQGEKDATVKNGTNESCDSDNMDGLRCFSNNDENIPYFPEDFEVAKYDILEKLQKQIIPVKTSEKARKVYASCIEDLKKKGFRLRKDFPSEAEYLASRKLQELIRDMLNVQETNMSVPNPSSLSKYRALRCRIDALDSNTEEFHKVKQQLDQNTSECPVKNLQIYKVGRITEAATFESHLGNIQSLIHASSPSNFVGILSRGLLLPKIAVEEHGLERTDCGNLGSGIYFSNSISTSIKYSQPSRTDGARLLVICDVALGTCWDTCQTNSSLTAAPPGYDSVHGVSKRKNSNSAFEDDEFVVYKTNQVKIKYVVKFSLAYDRVKEFHPVIQTELEDQVPSHDESQPEDYEMPSQNPLDNITAGLLDRSGNQIPLKDVHIKGRIIDFVAQERGRSLERSKDKSHRKRDRTKDRSEKSGKKAAKTKHLQPTPSRISPEKVRSASPRSPVQSRAGGRVTPSSVSAPPAISEPPTDAGKQSSKPSTPVVCLGTESEGEAADPPALTPHSPMPTPPRATVSTVQQYRTSGSEECRRRTDSEREERHSVPPPEPVKEHSSENWSTKFPELVFDQESGSYFLKVQPEHLSQLQPRPSSVPGRRGRTPISPSPPQYRTSKRKYSPSPSPSRADSGTRDRAAKTRRQYSSPSPIPSPRAERTRRCSSPSPVRLSERRTDSRHRRYSPSPVVVFQTYENQTGSPIEAKYVFPLDDTAAVCGFEAFIKGKHIIGEVKEKEKAHQEYREAVSRGDGAYLMDQDAPDIFIVSVGNLPPLTKVLIKITYITELSFKNGCLSFHLPATVAPWQQDKALNEITQDSVRKVVIKQFGSKAGWTHQLEIKKTDCKAVVRTIEGSSLDTSGFVMVIEIGDVHLPRMWVEKHPNKKSEACMLVFQPKIEASLESLSTYDETVICLDCSNSMAGSEIQQAKQIALSFLDSYYFIDEPIVIKFGTNFVEFPYKSENVKADYADLKAFIMSATATMGNSDLWKTLHYLSLLYTSKVKRNIVLISDGHIQNEAMTLQLVKQNAKHTRIFTCGVGPTANRHMLKSLSHYGAGAFEYFDAKSKYNWESKANAPELTYAPAQIQSLFNHERLLVYGFISNCTQATLHALIDNQELQTMVSTTELQKTTGTMLHKLAARAFIRDYEQGILHENETEHEMKKQLLKSLIIKLSLENSIVTQFTSFVAIEKRTEKEDQIADTLNVLELVTKEDVDILPYMQYLEPEEKICEPVALKKKMSKLQKDICFEESSDWAFPSEALPQLSEADFLSTLDLLSSDISIKDKKLSPKEFVDLQPASSQPVCPAWCGLGPIYSPRAPEANGASVRVETLGSRFPPPPRPQLFLSAALFRQEKMASQMALFGSAHLSGLQTVPQKEVIDEEGLASEDGFWQLTAELGILLDIDVDHLINVTLAKKGLQSLGPKGKEKLLQLIATLLVLQAARFTQLEGLIFKSLTKLNDSSSSWAFDPVKKAIAWTRKTEREFPAICQRLELGKDWDSATKKILGIGVIGTLTSPRPSNV
ncbi:hypothetical protein JD844_033266 [Phrynosoma platyrhinos]|uniref:Poly [ADP-ribose] polymerase n=1 Tax=Phrynosoma platyrhinos TaxID=52577 RepID=A0ABQ7T6R2_PHRPL|nr:hypothetical protein JD844_033266 [Phrynosoma platyrhinos]